jgi:predicted nucleic acid-binding protein
VTAFVLDASVTMAWAFREELTPFAERLLTDLVAGEALVPAIWPLEVANVLLVSERRGRINRVDVARFTELLLGMPIRVHAATEGFAFEEALPLARDTGLSVYDASYLELAGRLGLPLATLDAALERAAGKVGVTILS